MNAAETPALAPSAPAPRAVAADGPRAPGRPPGPGGGRATGGPPAAPRRAGTPARHRQVPAAPADGDEQLWGSA
ncbi:hypothetical protein ACN6AT_32930 [Streptomyces sp. JL4002]|uniref:hypothetical protein n=1 Tax=Streptomyces sp. JL4002 TaxID=3404781 RepID=UPI003B284F35